MEWTTEGPIEPDAEQPINPADAHDKQIMEWFDYWTSFGEWWDKEGRFLDPEPAVSWEDKRFEFAMMAWAAARRQFTKGGRERGESYWAREEGVL